MSAPLTPATIRRHVPRPALADASARAVAFHFQATCGHVVVGWAVDGGRAQARVVTEVSAAAALIDAYVALRRAYPEALRVYVGDALVREVLSNEVLVESVVTGVAMARAWERARNLAEAAMQPLWSQMHPAPKKDKVITIATDASMGRGKTAGIAYVTSEGAVGSTSMQAANIHEAEVSAIILALGRVPENIKQVTVLSDSQVAVRAVMEGVDERGIGKRAQRCRDLVEKLIYNGTRVNVQWVRAHNGHRLNEAADRVAVHARRCSQWKLRDQHLEFREQIRAELAAA